MIDNKMECDAKDCTEIRGMWLQGPDGKQMQICEIHRQQLQAHVDAFLSGLLGA